MRCIYTIRQVRKGRLTVGETSIERKRSLESRCTHTVNKVSPGWKPAIERARFLNLGPRDGRRGGVVQPPSPEQKYAYAVRQCYRNPFSHFRILVCSSITALATGTTE